MGGLVSAIIGAFSGGHVQPNPVMEELQRRIKEQEAQAHEAHAQQASAEEALRIAQEELQRSEEQMRVAEDAAKAQEEEIRRADEARRTAEDAAKRAEADRYATEEQMQQAAETARRAEEERARAEAEGARAQEEKRKSNKAAEQANQAAAEARAAQEEAQRQLQEGIRPIIIPTMAEFMETRRRLEYQEGLIHFAIAGIAGSGKSSLVNAFRGLRASDEGAAATGTTETTRVVTRYPDPRPDRPFVWYDVPGAGTLSISEWQYFTDQGLYVFDGIIVLFDARFTASDIAILRNCVRFQIPAYIVRSKSDQHIRNLTTDMGGGDDSDSEDLTLKLQARERYTVTFRP
ncbi:P-loop containing nucleoside triphosphate hydrolase protein [Daedalea quercina L-15889]|uniref:p-loop containing nucleoside triphosphate hydrolase protein n=1 Tax=Daedalea quercina L-15889 TaxID=1314783 RepID=A0A165QSS6_9APHY|nr:P-loop containing nucleoside triphosphate hydrolase protein [Daedalea quercina L-15889]